MMKRLIVICIAVFLSCIAAIGLGAGPSEMARAAERGDRAAVRELIAQKADVNAAQPDGATALHWAVYRNDTEMVDMRLEMLGTSFIPQHSDARVLEQVIYKWRSSRQTIAPVLANAYRLLVESGRDITPEDIQKDVTRLFRTNFEHFLENS